MNKRNKHYVPNIVSGGSAIPIPHKPNYYYMAGRKHEDGGIAIGANPKTGIEVEGGEVVNINKNTFKVFSSVPFLNGVSPAEKVINGENATKVFKQQEQYKDRNNLKDDGTKYKHGGSKYRSSDAIRSRIAKWEGESMKVNRSFDLEDRDFYNSIPADVRSRMSQAELDALYSTSYNIGAGNFKKRVVPHLVNLYNGKSSVDTVTANMYGARDSEPKMRGLRSRRKTERKLFADAYKANHFTDTNPATSETYVANNDNTYVAKPQVMSKFVMPKDFNADTKDLKKVANANININNDDDSNIGINVPQLVNTNAERFNRKFYKSKLKMGGLTKDRNALFVHVNGNVTNKLFRYGGNDKSTKYSRPSTGKGRGKKQSNSAKSANAKSNDYIPKFRSFGFNDDKINTSNVGIVKVPRTPDYTNKQILDMVNTNPNTKTKYNNSTKTNGSINGSINIDNLSTKVNKTNLYKTKKSNLIDNLLSGYTKEDAIGLGANIIGGIGSYFTNKSMLNSLKTPPAPAQMRAAKLKTKININPQLDRMRENLSVYEKQIDNNTASSNVALSRKQNIRLANIMNTNDLFANKENQETQSINQDKLNQQEVGNRNVAAHNEWLNNKTNFENTVREKKSENVIGLLDTINSGVQDAITRKERRDANDQNIRAYLAAHPNVSPEYLNAYGIATPFLIKRLGGIKINK